MWKKIQLKHTHSLPLLPLPLCAIALVPVQFADSSQPADVAPAAGQDGQMVGVQREEEALSGELGLRELGRVFICFM